MTETLPIDIAQRVQDLREAMFRAATPELLFEVMRKTLQKAAEGCVAAAKLCMTYLMPRPTSALDMARHFGYGDTRGSGKHARSAAPVAPPEAAPPRKAVPPELDPEFMRAFDQPLTAADFEEARKISMLSPLANGGGGAARRR